MPQVRGSFVSPRSNLTYVCKVINGEDLEQRAVACLTFARCIILAGDSTRKLFICRHVLKLTHRGSFCLKGGTSVRIYGRGRLPKLGNIPLDERCAIPTVDHLS